MVAFSLYIMFFIIRRVILYAKTSQRTNEMWVIMMSWGVVLLLSKADKRGADYSLGRVIN